MAKLIGAIEAGGTKFICAVGTSHADTKAQVTIQTTTPTETLAACKAFFRDCEARFGAIDQLGIAAFGPLDLDPASATHGALIKTPKPGWSGTNFIQYFEAELGCPVTLDTDVNGAVLAEVLWGAAQGCDSAVYVTIGTGIGGGVFVDGTLLHGLLHPELGHMPLPRAPGDVFPGSCPFHGDCLEGMASGPAMAQRWGQAAENLSDDHEAWRMEAFYLAQMCRTITLVLSPERIILGGGVMGRDGLMDMVLTEFDRLMAGYLPIAERTGGLDGYIVHQSLDGTSGLSGAFAVCMQR